MGNEKLRSRLEKHRHILEKRGAVCRGRRCWQVRWEEWEDGKRVAQRSIYIGNTLELKRVAEKYLERIRLETRKIERQAVANETGMPVELLCLHEQLLGRPLKCKEG